LHATSERFLNYRNITEINNMTSDMTFSEAAKSSELNKKKLGDAAGYN